MSANNYGHIFYMGTEDAIDESQIQNGKIKVATDTGRLYIDFDGTSRVEITDFVRGYSSSNIESGTITNPITSKIYIANDTGHLYIYLNNEWIDISGKAEVQPLAINEGGTGNTVGYIRTGQLSGSTADNNSTIEGKDNVASGEYSHAEGYITCAYGNNSHAEGRSTCAAGDSSHAEGSYTCAVGLASHAEGQGTCAKGNYSHAEGYGTRVNAIGSHAEGQGTCAENNYSHAEGYQTCAEGIYSHSEGYRTRTKSKYSHAEGYSTCATGDYSHAEGLYSYAVDTASHAEGYQTSAIGTNSHAEGYHTCAVGDSSHAEGYYTCAVGMDSHAEGYHTCAVGNSSHAEGTYTCAVSDYSHAEGFKSCAVGNIIHAIGNPDRFKDYLPQTAKPAGTKYVGYKNRLGNNIYTIDNKGNNWRLGDACVMRGMCATSTTYTPYIMLEEGAVYLLYWNSITYNTGKYLGAGSCLFASGFAGTKSGPTSTGIAALKAIKMASNGTVGITVGTGTTKIAEKYYPVIRFKGSNANYYTRYNLVKITPGLLDLGISYASIDQ